MEWKNCDIYKKFVLQYSYLLHIFISTFLCHNRISYGYSIICIEYLYISFQAIKLLIYNFFLFGNITTNYNVAPIRHCESQYEISL
jgi:hypothetical protein